MKRETRIEAINITAATIAYLRFKYGQPIITTVNNDYYLTLEGYC